MVKKSVAAVPPDRYTRRPSLTSTFSWEKRMNFRSITLPALTLLATLLTALPGSTLAATLQEMTAESLKTIGMTAGSPDLLVLTDAPYVLVDKKSALPFLDTVQQLTGCTVGKGNLLFFQRPQQHPLRFLLMAKTSGKGVIISRDNATWLRESVRLDQATISAPAFWEEVKTLHSGGDMSALAAIAAVWAKDAPYDFLKSTELHNHICPGLTSGYLIAHYIQNNIPLQEGEKYTLIASPVWCKEDALQVILDCTPGKRGLVVKPLSKEQIERIAFANPAGMVLVWNDKTKTGKGYALTFDFGDLKAGLPKDSPKVATVLASLDHLNEPEKFVATAASFDLNEGLYTTITEAGANPYEAAALVKR